MLKVPAAAAGAVWAVAVRPARDHVRAAALATAPTMTRRRVTREYFTWGYYGSTARGFKEVNAVSNEPTKGVETKEQVGLAYQAFMLLLCVYAILNVIAGALFPLTENARQILQYADAAVCAVFFIDFLVNLWRAPDKWRYMRTWGWIDLLSSVPAINFLRIGRIARLLRILRVLRALKVTRILAGAWASRRTDSVFYAAAIVTFTMIVLCSLAVLSFEDIPGGNIRTASNALWWAISTICTVGYGDYYPVTWEGRAIAIMLMALGFGLIGTLSGVAASWFLAPVERRDRAEISDLREAVEELRATIVRLNTPGSGDRGSHG
jgi:voltage-gated potassium channel